MPESGQKSFSNKPAVHLEYDVEIGNAKAQKQISWVMGVMSDLMGKPHEERKLPPGIPERKFLEFDAQNFEDRMKYLKPRVAFQVPSKFEEGKNLAIDLTFNSMDDFTPAGVARQVPELAFLLEQRSKLKTLVDMMDGRSSAENWLSETLQGDKLKELLAALDSKKGDEGSSEEG